MSRRPNIRKSLDSIQKTVNELDGIEIVVGVQHETGKNIFGAEVSGNDTYQNGKTAVWMALLHEYGYPQGNLPERPFIRKARVVAIPAMLEYLHKKYSDTVRGQVSVEQMAEVAGEKALEQFVGRLGTLGLPTKKSVRKGRSLDTLVDTGFLQDHITYRVVSK
jgi:hypothetical protein